MEIAAIPFRIVKERFWYTGLIDRVMTYGVFPDLEYVSIGG